MLRLGPKSRLSKSVVAAFACMAASVVLICSLGFWGASREIELLRSTRLNAELAKLRAQATRRAGHIEEGLSSEIQGTLIDWETERDEGWLARYWSGVHIRQEGQLYAAIVDPSGIVVLHNDPAVQNASLGRHWYDQIVDEPGGDVVQTRGRVLAGGRPAYDIRVPIQLDGIEVASYHEGLSQAWLETQLSSLHGQVISRWTAVIAGILVVVCLAFVSLMAVVRRKAEIQQLAERAEVRRVNELNQLIAGLAHEIRNPLHAIRLNLHAFHRVLTGQAQLDEREVRDMIGQSAKEIDRVEHLMNELQSFATPREAQNEVVDLRSEVKATVDFLEQEFLHKNLQLTCDLPDRAVRARIDPGRLRQVLLNLLVNAQEAVTQGGKILVGLRRQGENAEIIVADDGPGVEEDELERVFDPFHSTKEAGYGLGLSLVKRFVEEAGGEIHCESNSTGATFRISLPALTSRHGEQTSKEI